MFKSYMRQVSDEMDKPSRGLGDTFTKVTTIIGVKQAVDFFSRTMKKDCGCSKRTKALNEFFAYSDSVDRYIAFFVTRENSKLFFNLIDCQQHSITDFSSVKERPIFVLRWKNERFAITEYEETKTEEISHADTLSLLNGLMRSEKSHIFFNKLSNGKFGMTYDEVATLQSNISIFLRNHA